MKKMDAKAVWKHGLSFTGSADTGFELPLGASPVVGGENDGFRPMELFAIGLAGCTGMDVISILKKKQQDVTAFEVRAHTRQRDEHPRTFVAIELEYVVTGRNVDLAAVQRSVELSITRYCPAYATLSQVAPVTYTITLLEA